MLGSLKSLLVSVRPPGLRSSSPREATLETMRQLLARFKKGEFPEFLAEIPSSVLWRSPYPTLQIRSKAHPLVADIFPSGKTGQPVLWVDADARNTHFQSAHVHQMLKTLVAQIDRRPFVASVQLSLDGFEHVICENFSGELSLRLRKASRLPVPDTHVNRFDKTQATKRVCLVWTKRPLASELMSTVVPSRVPREVKTLAEQIVAQLDDMPQSEAKWVWETANRLLVLLKAAPPTASSLNALLEAIEEKKANGLPNELQDHGTFTYRLPSTLKK